MGRIFKPDGTLDYCMCIHDFIVVNDGNVKIAELKEWPKLTTAQRRTIEQESKKFALR